MEIWKDIKGYEGLYRISSLGRILSLQRTFYTGRNNRICTIPNTIMSPSKTKKGYLRVTLYKDGQPKGFQVHRLVAEAFIPNPNNLPEVNHKNEIKDCNKVDNLEWCTSEYNIKYSKAYIYNLPKAIDKVKRKVIQMNLDDKFIKEWESASEAAKFLGISQSSISQCCRNKRNKCGNYKWKFK